MSSLNEAIKKISIIEIALVLIIALAIILSLNFLFNLDISEEWIYVAVILYIIYKVRNYRSDFITDAKNIFSKISPKFVILIVVVNVFFSYGMLYGFNLLVEFVPGVSDLLYSTIITVKSTILFDIFTTVIVAPIAEELIFRGVLLNRLTKYLNLPLAILISSIVFGALHNPGSIISAFVFGLCMAIMYIKSQNILLPIFAHFLNNLIAEILYYGDPNDLIFTNPLIIVGFSILALLSLYLIIISLKSEWKKIT